MREFSFISGFRVEAVAGDFVADPQIGICQVGTRLVVHPRRDATLGTWHVDVQADASGSSRS